jgi:hypothetical protein
MATDFAVFLHRFLTSHLAGLRGCSPNTIASYRDTFKLLIAFFRDGRSIPPDKLTRPASRGGPGRADPAGRHPGRAGRRGACRD